MTHSHDHSHSHSHDHSHSHGGIACQHDHSASEEERQELKYFHKIIQVYRSYAWQTQDWLQTKQDEWDRLSQKDQELLPEYQQKLNEAKLAILGNTQFLAAIVPPDPEADRQQARVPEHEMEKLRSTLRQFVRDWSVEGKAEREQTYGRIYDELQRLFPASESRADKRILVPGAGLGRMVYDLASMGFSCQGNEFSFYMLLASNFTLNRLDRVGEFTVYPWVHSFSNQRTAALQLKAVTIPDILPRDIPTGVEFSMAAGEFLEVYQEDQEEWDAVVTCFFLDTAHNVMDYLRTIWRVLKPGGYWLNLGPLLYHYEGMDSERSVEFTLEEIKLMSERLGFELSRDEQIRCTYAGNDQSMLVYDYRAAFWVARKPVLLSEGEAEEIE